MFDESKSLPVHTFYFSFEPYSTSELLSIPYSADETLMLVSILYSCWAQALPKTRGCLAFGGVTVNTMAFYKGALFAPNYHYISYAEDSRRPLF